MRANQEEISLLTHTIRQLDDQILKPLNTKITNNSTYLTPDLHQRLSSLAEYIKFTLTMPITINRSY